MALPKTRQVELIDKHKFARPALNKNSEIFVISIIALKALELVIYLSRVSLLATL